MPDGRVTPAADSDSRAARWAAYFAAWEDLAARGRPAGEAVELAKVGIRLAEEDLAAAEDAERQTLAQDHLPLVGWLIAPGAAFTWWWCRRRQLSVARSWQAGARSVLAGEKARAAEVLAACEALLRRGATASSGP